MIHVFSEYDDWDRYKMKLTKEQAESLGRSMEELYDDEGMSDDDKPGYAWDGIKDFIKKRRHLKEAIRS